MCCRWLAEHILSSQSMKIIFIFGGLLSGVINQALSGIAKPSNRLKGWSSLHSFKEPVSKSNSKSRNN